MKRIAITIHPAKHPEHAYLGYALANEFNQKSFNFFSTVKFHPDDELEIQVSKDGEVTRYKTVFMQLQEQISSGRIMNAVPDANHPFPARTFYRCYARVDEIIGATSSATETEAKTEPEAQAEPAPAEAPAAEAVADTPESTEGAQAA